jgi:hypothetical protein
MPELRELFDEHDTVTRIVQRTAAIPAADAACDKILAAAKAGMGIKQPGLSKTSIANSRLPGKTTSRQEAVILQKEWKAIHTT